MIVVPTKLLKQQFINHSASCPPGARRVDYYDTRVQGLSLKVLPSGRQTYYVRFRDRRNKIVERKLGNGTIIKLSKAREMAQDVLARVAMGEDPFETRRILQEVPTLAELIEKTYLPHIQGYKRSWSNDMSMLHNHILPVLGKLHLDEIKRQHLVEIFSRHRQSHRPASTNRLIVLMRYIFNCALRWEVEGITRNPTAGIELYLENNKRERYLKEDEALRLFEALEASPNQLLPFIVAMLLLTGARRREVLNARWSDLDLDHRLWRIEFNKTGKTRHVPLSDGMMGLLNKLPRHETSDYLFTNPRTGKPFVKVFTSWDTARRRAGMPDLRIHDLRHSFASYVINAGHSLYEVQKLLGHTQVTTTQRYAHLSNDTLLTAAEKAADVVPWDREAREAEGQTGVKGRALPGTKTKRPARQSASPREAPPGQTVSPPADKPPSGEEPG
ncbi:MAG: tyrosine-type recombinase/integrase [Pseudomonadota bacterium]